MATLNITKSTTAEALRKEFNEAFGAQIKIYNGNKEATPSDTLNALGLTAEGVFECRSSLTVASFIERMKQEHGLTVKVYTCDEWVAVFDGLTLESAGKVKKNAVEADMESMIAYQRKDNNLQGYEIEAREDGGYTVRKDGVECTNAKAAMREMAAILGMEVDPNWTTRQLGAKIMKAISNRPQESPAANKAAGATADAKAKEEQNRAEADKAKAELERQQAEAAAEKAKAEAKRLAAESAAVAAAKEAALKAKAELERQQAEAAAAKAELERIKAEAAQAQAEAEKAKAAAAAAKKEAETAKEAATPAPSASKVNSNNGALNGLFSVAANKKVHFSMGNLQFNPKKYEFRFAPHQYDVIGNDNTKIAPNYDGWIDLFGYGTSGYMGREPTETDSGDLYGQCDIANTNYDWGVYNPISNGGNKEGLWRTLTEDEWRYLLKTRANAIKLRAKACVNGINGVVLLPDDFYEHRVRVPFDSTPGIFAGNSYDLAQWAILEEAGAIFLPCGGARKYFINKNYMETEYNWMYWTSTGSKSNGLCAHSVCLSDTDPRVFYIYMGFSVRLAQDVK